MIKSHLHHKIKIGPRAVDLFSNGLLHFYGVHIKLGKVEQEYLVKWISREVEFTTQDVGS